MRWPFAFSAGAACTVQMDVSVIMIGHFMLPSAGAISTVLMDVSIITIGDFT